MSDEIKVAGVSGGIKVMHLVFVAISAAIAAILDAFGVISTPIIPGVAAFYPGMAFFVGFGIWFGVWGLIGVYIGTVIGGLITGMPLLIALLMKLANPIQVFVPTVVWKLMKLDPKLKDKMSMIMFIIFGAVLGPLVGASWGVGTLVGVGFVPASLFWIAWWGWFLGDMLIMIVLGIPIMLLGSPYVERSGLYVKGWLY
ncbi:MAG: hypothetical protein ACP6IS_02225 [Candidatus Asgardarchaeia archaeon]